ncbi:NUDIX hydrolase [Sphaerochaeta sp. PS]|uniref:NUDIX hydrolase n=1 Tax=Sphaerochaeta sp. PS TaxID=3076336 RepID=UPI0028A4C103|nr:NUDIX domain-containing protein [Sphaerochaeta sp. PS]MDT4761063.1 NUDIX domain-containing protein [Sphaerochaeta sp. PS]
MPEYFDLYDNDRNPLGRVHQRGVPIPEGLYHVVVSVWTVNKKQEILLTLRSAQKQLLPNLWENTSGSVLAGESSREAALRELREETGIIAESSEMTFLGTARKAASFVDIFLVRKDAWPIEVVLQKEETVDAKWVTFPELEVLDQRGELAFPISYHFVPFTSQFKKSGPEGPL